MNKWMVAGVIGLDPDVVEGGVSFTVFVKEKGRPDLPVKCFAFGKISEVVTQYVKAKSKIVVEGALRIGKTGNPGILVEKLYFM